MNLIVLLKNLIMKGGKAGLSERQIYKLLEGLNKEQISSNKKGLILIVEGLESLSPLVRILKKKIGGTVYRIPAPMRKRQKMSQSVVFFIARKGGNLKEGLMKEVLGLTEEAVLLDLRRSALHEVAAKNSLHVRFLNSKLRV